MTDFHPIEAGHIETRQVYCDDEQHTHPAGYVDILTCTYGGHDLYVERLPDGTYNAFIDGDLCGAVGVDDDGLNAYVAERLTP